MSRNGTLTLLSLFIALASSIVIGSLFGWSSNPDKTHSLDLAWKEMDRSSPAKTVEEWQKLHHELAQKQPGYFSPAPNPAIAILKSHPYLLGALSLLLLCLFRPSAYSVLAVFVPASVACYFIIGLSTAISLLIATALSLVWPFVYARLRATKANP